MEKNFFYLYVLTNRLKGMESITHRCCLLFVLVLFSLPVFADNTDPSVAFDESEVIKRIELMESEVAQARYDVVVRSYLRTYLVNHREKAEKILGRRILYFPIFEDYLRQGKLPLDLKYLSIVESALEPKATSRVGAAGLWQFMPTTGRAYGLQVDAQVDERRDPHKSTEAAVKHLQDLYAKFDSWELAIAAYNSGSGRVSRAVKRGRSSSYWKIRGFLPKETRNYVPAFIAATYLVRHFEDHGLEPDVPELDLQMTETISIFQEVTFQQAADVTGIPEELIAQLNPAFPKGIVPASQKGYYFTLPARAIDKFRIFLESERPDFEGNKGAIAAPVMISRNRANLSPQYRRTTYLVQEGETLETLAQRFHCSVYQIRAWNKMKPSQQLSAGQQVLIYQLKDDLPFLALERIELFEELPNPLPEEVAPPSLEASAERELDLIMDNAFILYYVRRPESVMDISLKFLIDVQQIRQLNDIVSYRNLKSGSIVKLARLNRDTPDAFRMGSH